MRANLTDTSSTDTGHSEAERLAFELAEDLERWIRDQAERMTPSLASHVALGAAGLVYRRLLATWPAAWGAAVDEWAAAAARPGNGAKAPPSHTWTGRALAAVKWEP